MTLDARVLAVDDDPSLLRTLKLSLMLGGFTVESATDGIDALEKIEGADFDVVVLDLQMPRMDGRTFFREIRARGIKVPVLLLSAYGATQARTELNAEDAIGKPFNPLELVEKVKALIRASVGEVNQQQPHGTQHDR